MKKTLTEQIEDSLEDAKEIKDILKMNKIRQVFEWCDECPYYKNCYDEYGGPYCMEPSCAQFKPDTP